ncbi:hypothetical protein MPER_02678, partial [Moniliophthora perniciosa FA553]
PLLFSAVVQKIHKYTTSIYLAPHKMKYSVTFAVSTLASI